MYNAQGGRKAGCSANGVSVGGGGRLAMRCMGQGREQRRAGHSYAIGGLAAFKTPSFGQWSGVDGVKAKRLVQRGGDRFSFFTIAC